MPSSILLFERTGAWRRALRVADPSLPHVREMRSIEECRDALRKAPHSLLGLALTRNDAASVLAFLDELRRGARNARCVVLCEDELRALEWEVRELGAVHVVDSPRRMDELAAIARRHLAMFPPAEDPTIDRIWKALPFAPGSEA